MPDRDLGVVKVKQLPLSTLSVVWRESQREYDWRRVDAMTKDFRPHGIGVLTVACIKNEGGADTYHIIDGQHRWGACTAHYGESHKVYCEILYGIATPKGAAEVWAIRNTGQKKPGALTAFMVSLTEERPESLEIRDIIYECGFTLGSGYGVQAISVVVQTYRKHGPDGLRWVLNALRETWGNKGEAVAGELVRGFSDVYGKFGEVIDVERMAVQLNRRYSTSSMIGAAKAGKAVLEGGMAESIVRLVLKSYNLRLSPANHLTLAA